MSILGCVDEEAEDTAGLSLANCDEMNALSGGVTDDDLSLVEPSGVIRMPSAECVDGEAEDTVGLSLANCEELNTVQEQELMRGVTDDDLSLAERSGVIRMPSAECLDGEAENTVGLGLANCEELKNVREKDLRGGVTDDALSLAEPSGVTRMPSTECVDGETNDAAGLSLDNCKKLKNEPEKEMEGGVTYDGLSLAEPSGVKTNEGKMMFGKHLIMGGVNYDTLSLAEPSGVNKHEGELPSEKYCGGEVICDALSLAEPSGIDKSEGEKKFKEQLWGGVIYDDPSLAELSNENADEGGLVNNENESLSLAQNEQPGMYQESEMYMKCENTSQKCAERGLAQESGLSLADGGLVRTVGGVSVADKEAEVLAGTVIIEEVSQNEQNEMLILQQLKENVGASDLRVAQLSMLMRDCENEKKELSLALNRNEWYTKNFEENLEIFGWIEEEIVNDLICKVTSEKEKELEIEVERHVKRKAENLQNEELCTTPSKKQKTQIIPKKLTVNPIQEFLDKFRFKKTVTNLSTTTTPKSPCTTPENDIKEDSPPPPTTPVSDREIFMSKFSQAKSIFEEKKSSLSSPPQRNKRKYKKSTKTTKHCTTPKVIQIWKKTSDSKILPKKTIDHNFDRSGTSNKTMCEKPRDSIKLVRKVTTQGSQPQRTPPTPPPPHPTTTTQPLTPPMPNTITLESFPNNSSGCESLQELFRNVDPPNGGTGLKVLPRPSVQDTTQVPPPPPTNQPLPTTIKCRTQEHRLQEKLDPQPLPPGNRTTGSTLPPPLTDLALPPITRITTNLQKNLLLRTVDPPVNEKLSRVAELRKSSGKRN